MPLEINEQEIIRYYEQCQVDYEIVWHLGTHMCMHYGFWDETTPNLRAALGNMNTRLAEYAGISKGDLVLDAGCGIGGSSIFLAKNFGCNTIGITLSEKQVLSAEANALKHNVGRLCSFQRGNYLETAFEDNTFDVVWAIESVCYAYDKLDFLKEAYRVLKPGGRLIVADFYSLDLEQGASGWDLMNKWTDTWAIKSYAGVSEFRHKMQLAGFNNCRDKDVTSNVLKSIKRLYYAFFPGAVATYTGQLLGLRNKWQTANTWSTYYQYRAYKKGLWRYMFFSGAKPFEN